MDVFRKQLKYYLDVRKMTAAELARRTGVPKQTICDWLTGTHPRKMQFVKKVGDELGVSILELFFGTNTSPETSQSDGPKPVRALKSTAVCREENIDFYMKMFVEGRGELSADRHLKRKGDFNNPELIPFGTEIFFRYANDLLQVRHLTGFPVVFSPSWETVLGWSIEELESRHWLDCLHPEDRSTTIRAVEDQLLKGLPVGNCKHRYLRKGGGSMTFDTTFQLDVQRSVLITVSKACSTGSPP